MSRAGHDKRAGTVFAPGVCQACVHDQGDNQLTNPFKLRSWSPYVVGVGIGVLSWFAFVTANQPLGVSTAFEHTSAFLIETAAPAATERNEYFQANAPKINWGWMLVVGVFLGALLSAWWSGDRTNSTVPALWESRFGSSAAKRLAAAFLGGALMLFGARLAGGCTSGHAISGGLQLAASSWLFTVTFFAVAIAASQLLYRQKIT
jgi:uncharacterized membrane protein YedE/YeeE